MAQAQVRILLPFISSQIQACSIMQPHNARRRQHESPLERNSRALSYLLRHSESIARRPDGYAPVCNVLAAPNIHMSSADLHMVVDTSFDKRGVPRFEIICDGTREWVRASGKRSVAGCESEGVGFRQDQTRPCARQRVDTSETSMKLSKELCQLLRRSTLQGRRSDGFCPMNVVLSALSSRPSMEEVKEVLQTSTRPDGSKRLETCHDGFQQWIRASKKETPSGGHRPSGGARSQRKLHGQVALSEKVSVSVITMAGNVVWGPTPTENSSSVDDVRCQVAEVLQQPRSFVKLVHGDKELHPSEVLKRLDMSLPLYCTVLGPLSGAQALLDVFSERFLQWTSDCCREGYIVEAPAQPEDEIPMRLEAILAASGLTVLPEEVSAWLQVILASGKKICRRYCFDLGLSCFGDGASGLICFSTANDDNDERSYVVDGAGLLAHRKGQTDQPCGVWLVGDYEPFFGRDFDDDCDHGGDDDLDYVFVAPSLTAFFESAIESEEAMERATDPEALMEYCRTRAAIHSEATMESEGWTTISRKPGCKKQRHT